MAKKLIKSEKLQRQIEKLNKRFGGRSEETTEQTEQDAASATQNQRKPTEPVEVAPPPF